MKVVAIICLWDDWDLAYIQIDHLIKHRLVDDIFVVYSEYSNSGEFSPFIFKDFDVEFIPWEPDLGLTPMVNETNKRNYALEKAIDYGFTHFIVTDADEYYHPEHFHMGKEILKEIPELNGIVVPSQVYFKNPKLTIGLDTTLVPFIHKITPELKHSFNRNYPYAWQEGKIRIDPTRSMNINDGVIFKPEIVMHHYSWVRLDYEKKIRNSTARANIERSTIRQDLVLAKEGYFCNFYGKVLHTAANHFNLPEYGELVQNL